MASRNPLARPFPDRNFDRSLVIGHARIGLFVFVFLYLFQPIGMRTGGENYLLICLGYGLVTFLVATAYSYLTSVVLGWNKSGPKWTLGRWILDCAGMLAGISVANFVYYNALVGWTAFDATVLLYIAVPTVLVGLFPIAFTGMATQMRAERENQTTASAIVVARNNMYRSPPATPPADRTTVALGNDGFRVRPDDILYCEARQNYVAVHYRPEPLGENQTELLRATLASMEAQLAGTSVVRCHRSYLVNTGRVAVANGNAQGLQLQLIGLGEERVPVSRSYVKRLREEVLG